MSLENGARELLARRAKAHGNGDLRKKYLKIEGARRARGYTASETFSAVREATAQIPPAHPNLVTDVSQLPKTPLK